MMRGYILSFILIAATPAVAIVPARDMSNAGLYMRARAAEVAGDTTQASADLVALLAREPADKGVLQRIFRQAITADDMALAVRTAQQLDQAGALPPDGRPLLAMNAVRGRNWTAANAAVDRLASEQLFAFLVPLTRAWIAQASRKGDPEALLQPAAEIPVARGYYPEQRVLLLLAQRKTMEALALARTLDNGNGGALSGPARLILADAVAQAGKREDALTLLPAGDAAFAAARTAVNAGERLARNGDAATTALSILMTRVAGDFARQRIAPIALIFARTASFAAPENSAAWLISAEILAGGRRPEAALAALDRIDARDPTAPLAASLRIGVLNGSGDSARALAEAQAAAERERTPLAWARLGDVQMIGERPKEAAEAYGRAVTEADSAKAPTETLWPLLLQWGGALDRAGDWPAARTAMERAYALAPREAAVLNQYGYSQIERRENVAEASRLIEQASLLRPDDAAITDSLGWAHVLRGRADQGVPLLEKAAAGDPAQSEISEHLGDAYWLVGRRYEARFAWRAALVTAADRDKDRLSGKIDNGLSPETAAP
jgi:tetratricopeptide (TPR) repeat protein